MWDVSSDQWETGFSHLKEFSQREGHCQVVGSYKTDGGFRLGAWVSSQRIKKEEMELDRRQRLEALPGWSWSVRTVQWEEGFSRLKEYSEREGHSRVVGTYKTDDDYPLGSWVSTQRRTKETLELDRKQRLEALPNWSWDAFTDKWEEGFFQLKEFSDREGHCRVPKGYKTDGYRLDTWVRVQRPSRDKIDPVRRQRLEGLPGWSWNPFADKWEDGFSHLKEFSEREGHCRAPLRYKTNDDYPLGRWVGIQRQARATMGTDRQQRLEALPGWFWKIET